MESLTERDAATAYARAWNRLDCSEFVELLAPDACYTSQFVFSGLQGKAAISDYLAGKIKAVRNGKQPVYAELGKTTISFPDKYCVAMAQSSKDLVVAVTLFEVEGGLIKHVNMLIPDLVRPVRSGQYPS